MKSTCDFTGENPDQSEETFTFDGAAFSQLTDGDGCDSYDPSQQGPLDTVY